MKVLVTGANGMIGSRLVMGLLEAGYEVVGLDRTDSNIKRANYTSITVDLSDKDRLKEIVNENNIDRIIHLAALAHRSKERDLSWEHYNHINVECAKNVFEIADDRPVLFISTVDVFGFYDGKERVNVKTKLHPVTKYGKSKALAENECKKIKQYNIFRFSPVYTETIKRDIQKRYYLKYPNVAYRIGKGTYYEILDINLAVSEMVNWCRSIPNNEIRIIKDSIPMWTPDYIEAERKAGRAKIVLYFPKWIVTLGYSVLYMFLGKTDKIYLLNKAIHPLKTE